MKTRNSQDEPRNSKQLFRDDFPKGLKPCHTPQMY